ncbi:hypothetical protein A3F29_02220 [Candidatus Roizmanbacteria bacterium RIFCSPHIGHO2_12_FULL_33_9]|uniref:Cytidylate kinase n=1 Tax=Candidatus Roizmanbacteria bacterium RIFCSPHIGHO2_12_FULL_33_9 TaxID=1802045 RepID=A0A1F7HIK8_9BACT|nr:MAG: hypothetical protein A3F29_02220 [Candidatus Roizmanbacteria bacterium RIFCSPHIGHO2_12_FULL_33_9]
MRRFFELIEKNLLLSKISKKTSGNNLPKIKPVITISREFGSSGSIFAEKIAKKLGRKWKAYHSEIVDKIAKNANLEKKIINKIDESDSPIFNQIIGDFFGKRNVNLSSYSKHLVKVVSAIGARGHAIIVGRGGNFLLPNSLKVRIITDMEQRIKTVMKFRQVSKSTAISMIEASDKKRAEFTKQLFSHSNKNAYNYDIVIKTGGLIDSDDAIELIVYMAKKKFKL